jgi:hypothetical protein
VVFKIGFALFVGAGVYLYLCSGWIRERREAAAATALTASRAP